MNMLHDETEWKAKFNEAVKAQQENKYEFAEHTWYVAVEEAEIFGPQDVRLAKTLDKLTEFLLLRGKLDEAAQFGYRSLSIYENGLGENADELANILGNLAMLAKIKNNLPEAERLYRRALAVNTRVLGPGEPRVKQLLTEFANVLDQLGRTDEANQLRGTKQRKDPGFMTMAKGIPAPSFVDLDKSQGKIHVPRTISKDDPNQKSGAFRALSHLMAQNKAGITVTENKSEVEKKADATQPGSFNRVREKAEQLQRERKLAESKQLWQDYIDQTPEANKNKPDYCYALESLANIATLEKKHHDVVKLLGESLEIKAQALGSEHPVVGSVSSDLAKAFYSLRQYEKAERFAVKCLNIYATVYGEDSIEVANACHNLGTLYHMQKKYDQAEKFYYKALPIKQRVLGNQHHETVRLRNAFTTLLDLKSKEPPKTKSLEDTSSEISGAWRIVDIPDSKPGWWKDEIFKD